MRNKIRMFLSLVAVSMLFGCTPETEDVTNNYNLPQELKDYKLFKLSDINGNHLYVMARVNKEKGDVIAITTPSGKTFTHTIIVDGEQYGRIEK